MARVSNLLKFTQIKSLLNSSNLNWYSFLEVQIKTETYNILFTLAKHCSYHDRSALQSSNT